MQQRIRRKGGSYIQWRRGVGGEVKTFSYYSLNGMGGKKKKRNRHCATRGGGERRLNFPLHSRNQIGREGGGGEAF